ncbi:MAG: carboxypeptidase regulatory-like domain-containing protein, partial [Terriglobales bacterium]
MIFVGLASMVAGQSVSTVQVAGMVRDATGAGIPGAVLVATQASTGFTRSAQSDGNGSYTLSNLPIGPYSLKVTKTGFNAYLQTGIVLQVASNPTLNVTLQVGSVTQEVSVSAGAAMVETHATGVGEVVDERPIVDLPLNGRQATDLILLAGAANAAPGGDLNSNKNYPTQTISVAGGQINGIAYLLDGASNNDPFNSLNLPFPFPDALQEFKVQTSALPAQYGQHASAAVNVVTKAGGNQLHGDLFEFVRNGAFNANNFFSNAKGLPRDSLKRNQFGGTIGGPIIKDKLFFFGGYQGTVVRSNPPTRTSFGATQAMLNGDFTTVTSSACQTKPITLAAPFVKKQFFPSQFYVSALEFLNNIPVSR